MDVILYSFRAITPILLLILLGYLLRRIKLFNTTFVDFGNKLLYTVLLPALLFYAIYSVESIKDIGFTVVIYGLIMLTVLFAIGIVIAKVFIKDPRKKGVIHQAITRSNLTILGIPLADALAGQEAVTTLALLTVFILPIMNVYSVIELTMYEKNDMDKKSMATYMVKKTFTNPSVLGALAGMAVLLLRWAVPEATFFLRDHMVVLYKTIENIARITSPFALILLGAGFMFSFAGKHLAHITLGTVFRIVLSPILVLGLAVLLDETAGWFYIGDLEMMALLAVFASPVAVTSNILAAELGDNDTSLSAQLVVWSSIFSIVSIFVFVSLLKAFAYL